MKFVKLFDVNEYQGWIIVHTYNTRQIKTRQFALPKAHSNSGARMIKYSAMEISFEIPSEIRNITCLAIFAVKQGNMHYSATRNVVCVLIGGHKPGALI